jgi:hypothetical protein
MAVITGGQGWEQIGDLALAFALSSLIGLAAHHDAHRASGRDRGREHRPRSPRRLIG